MGWVNPTSNVANGWADPTYAYNDNTADYASISIAKASWSAYLELYIGAIDCDKVQIYCSGQTSDIDAIRVDVYYSGGWHNIKDGALTQGSYQEYAIGSTQTVTGMRISLYNSKSHASRNGYIHDADFNQVGGGQNYPISTSCGLTASTTVAYQAAFDRGMSPGLAANVTIAKAFGRLVTTIAGLAISAAIDRTLTSTRVVSSSITVISSILRSVTFHWSNKP